MITQWVGDDFFFYFFIFYQIDLKKNLIHLYQLGKSQFYMNFCGWMPHCLLIFYIDGCSNT